MRKIRNAIGSGNRCYGYAGPVDNGRGGSRKTPENFSGASPPVTCKILSLILSLILTGFFTLSAASCKNPTATSAPVVCECDEKEHLGIDEKCCKDINCECKPKVYATIFDNTTGSANTEVNIYRKGAVVDMAGAVAKAQEAYADLNGMQRGALLNNFLTIYIIPGMNRNHYEVDEKFIIELGEERNALNMRNYLASVANIIWP